MNKPLNILFVCTGNSCRSVMAEYYFKKCIENLGLDGFNVFSAGVSGMSGLRASAETQIILEQHGISALNHRATGLTMKEVMKADYIFAMEEYHRNHILSMSSGLEEKVYLLSEFGRLTLTEREKRDIDDPIGQSMAFYEQCFNIIKRHVERTISTLTLVIALGADHGGFELKESIKNMLIEARYAVKDFGTHSEDSCDYPLIASELAQSISSKESQRGILICKSGIGMTIAANKVRGVRAAVLDSVEIARSSREHNDCNVCVFGAERPKQDEFNAILESWLETQSLGDRHKRRVDQIAKIEQENKTE